MTLVDEPTATVMAKMLLSSFSNEDDDDDDDDNCKVLEMMRFGSLPCIQRSAHTFTHFGKYLCSDPIEGCP